MKPQAEEQLVPFLLRCGEGYCDWLYLDVKRNVTVGVGVLLPNLQSARELDWRDPDGSPASPVDVARAWAAVTSRPDLASHGGGAYAPLTSIGAARASVEALILRKAEFFEAALRVTFSGIDDAPWQAQLGLMRLAWALGPHFAGGGRWPNFRRAWTASDWAICGAESRIPELDAVEPHANQLLRELFDSASHSAQVDVTDGHRDDPAYIRPD